LESQSWRKDFIFGFLFGYGHPTCRISKKSMRNASSQILNKDERCIQNELSPKASRKRLKQTTAEPAAEKGEITLDDSDDGWTQTTAEGAQLYPKKRWKVKRPTGKVDPKFGGRGGIEPPTQGFSSLARKPLNQIVALPCLYKGAHSITLKTKHQRGCSPKL